MSILFSLLLHPCKEYVNDVYGVETADETVCLRGAVVTPLEDSRMS